MKEIHWTSTLFNLTPDNLFADMVKAASAEGLIVLKGDERGRTMYLRGVSKANQEYFIDVEIGHADKFAGLTMRSMSNDPSATTRWKSVSAMDKIAKYLRDNFEPHIDPSDPNKHHVP